MNWKMKLLERDCSGLDVTWVNQNNKNNKKREKKKTFGWIQFQTQPHSPSSVPTATFFNDSWDLTRRILAKNEREIQLLLARSLKHTHNQSKETQKKNPKGKLRVVPSSSFSSVSIEYSVVSCAFPVSSLSGQADRGLASRRRIRTRYLLIYFFSFLRLFSIWGSLEISERGCFLWVLVGRKLLLILDYLNGCFDSMDCYWD